MPFFECPIVPPKVLVRTGSHKINITTNLSSINNLDGALSKTVKIIDLSFRQSEVERREIPTGEIPPHKLHLGIFNQKIF